MDISQLKSLNFKRKDPKRVGRGGKYRKTAGKGENGQKKRAGRTMRPDSRAQIKKIPKRRGYGINRGKTVFTDRPRPLPVNLSAVEKAFEKGEDVTPRTLISKGVIDREKGKVPRVKILGKGDLSKKLSFSNCLVSDSAKEKIEKAGGDIK